MMRETGTPWEKNKVELTEALENEMLSQVYGWDPDQIGNLHPIVKRKYLTILKGKSDAGG